MLEVVAAKKLLHADAFAARRLFMRALKFLAGFRTKKILFDFSKRFDSLFLGTTRPRLDTRQE